MEMCRSFAIGGNMVPVSDMNLRLNSGMRGVH